MARRNDKLQLLPDRRLSVFDATARLRQEKLVQIEAPGVAFGQRSRGHRRESRLQDNEAIKRRLGGYLGTSRFCGIAAASA